jgi:hypothetical protein
MRGQVSLKNFRQYPQVKSEYSINVTGAFVWPLARPSVSIVSAAPSGGDHNRPTMKTAELSHAAGRFM